MFMNRFFTALPRLIKSAKPKTHNYFHAALLKVPQSSQLPHNITLYSTEEKRQSQIKQLYYGSLTPQVKAVKFFSLSSSMIAVMAQPFLYNFIVGLDNVPLMVTAYTFVGFFTFVTPLLLHLLTRKYVTTLEYDQNTDTYIASTVNFFCVTRKIFFKAEEVTVPNGPAMFTTFVANGKPLFIEARLFENLDHLKRIMGYDKPIDFKSYNDPEERNKS